MEEEEAEEEEEVEVQSLSGGRLHRRAVCR